MQSAFAADSLRADTAAQARLDADNVRDDAALRSNLRANQASSAQTEAQSGRPDSSSLERAGRELSAAANSLKTTATQQQMDRLMGQMDVTGAPCVGAVVADAVDIERDYRQKMNKPMLDGAGETFSGRMAQAVGMQPVAGQPPISEPARFNALGDQALRLGLRGEQVQGVLAEQASSPDGRTIQPATRQTLIEQVQQTGGLTGREATQQVQQFLTVAASLPQEVRITGAIAPSRLERSQTDD